MKNVEMSDSHLLSYYAKGDEQAFSMLLNRHKGRVYTTIYLIVKDSYLAEDILQEVFIKAITMIKSGRYNEEGKFLPWILRIAHNMAIDQFRKTKRSPLIVTEDGSNIFNTLSFSETSAEDIQIKQDIGNYISIYHPLGVPLPFGVLVTCLAVGWRGLSLNLKYTLNYVNLSGYGK